MIRKIQLFSPTLMAIIQKFLGHYVHPWFAHPWFVNPPKPDQGGDQEIELDRIREGSATPPNEARRRASAPGLITLTGLRPPSSMLSVYHDAVVHIGTDSESD